MEKSDQSEAKTVYGRGRMGREVLGECSPQGSNLLGAEPVAGEPGKGQPARVREGAQWSWSPCGQGGVSVCCRPRSANSVSRGSKIIARNFVYSYAPVCALPGCERPHKMLGLCALPAAVLVHQRPCLSLSSRASIICGSGRWRPGVRVCFCLLPVLPCGGEICR